MHREAGQTPAPLHDSFLNISHLSSFLILCRLIIQPNGVIKYMMLSKQWLGASVCCCWKHIIDEEVGCHYQHIGRIMYLLHQCYSDGREMDSTYLATRQEEREIQLLEYWKQYLEAAYQVWCSQQPHPCVKTHIVDTGEQQSLIHRTKIFYIIVKNFSITMQNLIFSVHSAVCMFRLPEKAKLWSISDSSWYIVHSSHYHVIADPCIYVQSIEERPRDSGNGSAVHETF